MLRTAVFRISMSSRAFSPVSRAIAWDTASSMALACAPSTAMRIPRSKAPHAFRFGTRECENLNKLLALPKPFNVTKTRRDRNPAYASHISAKGLEAGKLGTTQKIERKHLSLRTWHSKLARKGIRFFKRRDMCRIVVVLVINF